MTSIDQQRFASCSALFARVKTGDEEITTSEATLAEVFFVLTSPRQYGLTPGDAAARLEPIVALKGLRLARKRLVRNALSLVVAHPRLGLEDALIAAELVKSGMQLLSYDSDFDRITGISRHEP